jgi:DNA-binding MarR family transcriptional regulator
VSTVESSGARDYLLAQLEKPRARPIDNSPLTWPDISFLVQGMAFASSSLHPATFPITERYDLGPRGTWMLNLISSGLNHPHELAEFLRIGRSLVSAELARLTATGLIVSRQGERDRRRSELALTPLGEETLQEVRDNLARLVTESLSHYKPRDLRICAQVLADMRNAVRASR